ncbi:MAG: hypothetical protein WAV25_01130 [Minisyncoccia bacterium]
MNEEFYHKDIFGLVVDLDLQAEEEFDIGPKARNEFNIWALTDAIAERKKKDAWVLYEKALASGMAAEEIFWKIVWVVKSLLIAQRTKDYTETDMKEFSYKKAKMNLKNYKPGELEKMSENLVLGLHNARRGKGEIDTLIEKTLLSL